jgi:ketosteroid isomerase-like protein
MKNLSVLFLLLFVIGIIAVAQVNNKKRKSGPMGQQHHKSNTAIKKAVSDFIAAVNSHDLKKIKILFGPNIKWSQPGNNRISGKKNTLAEVTEMFRTILELSASTLTIAQPQSILINGNSAIFHTRCTAVQPTGKAYDAINKFVLTIHEGLITNGAVFSSTPERENNFW